MTAELLSVPLKKTNDIDLTKPLKTLISSTCSIADQPQDFTDYYYWFLLLKNTVIHLKQKIIIHNITNLAK